MMKVPCYLTFDDGPFQNTSNILNILQATGVKGDFFSDSKKYGTLTEAAVFVSEAND